MNTPTHALINWTAARMTSRRFPPSAVLLGSIAPDIPLYGLSFGGVIWFRWVKQWEWERVGNHLFADLFYNDPWWITLHHSLHSPTVLVIALLATRLATGATRFMESWWSWFFASCMLHTLVDIPVHHDDGPLVFWPFNWSYRYASPVSYWDPDHFGRPTMMFEALLTVALLARLLWLRVGSKRAGPTPGSSTTE
ncbi:MAG: metal-dependent hydrolase [Planctomycetota bacterium]